MSPARRRAGAAATRLVVAGALLGALGAAPGCGGEDWRRSLEVRGFASELSGRGDDHAAYRRARLANTSTFWAAYLASFPRGLHVEEARVGLDEASWREAEAAGTEAAFLAYAQRFPRGAHAAEAPDRAGAACYAAATAQREVAQLRAAFHRYPARVEAAPTLRLIERLELEAALAGVDPLAPVRFLLSYPGHPRSGDVAQRLGDLERVAAVGLDRPLVFSLWLERFPGHPAAAELRERLKAMPAAPFTPPQAPPASEWVTAARCAVSLSWTIRGAGATKGLQQLEAWREELAAVLADPALGDRCTREFIAVPADPLARASLDALGALGTELGQVTRLLAAARENGQVLRNIIDLGRSQVETLERREVVGDALGEGAGTRSSELARQAIAQASAGAASADKFTQELETLEQQLRGLVVTLMRYATWALDSRQ